jgi:glycosyltransferase involved in cell wall biosynthesis
MYHGSLVERHGLDLAVEAISSIKQAGRKAELRIYGRPTPFIHSVMDSVRVRGLAEEVIYCGERDLNGIAEAIDACDLGVIPNRKSTFTELNLPTRIFEYLARAKPVIAPLTPGISDYFRPDELLFFTLGDGEDLAARIRFVMSHPDEISDIVRRGQAIYRLHRWSVERMHFMGFVSNLIHSHGRLNQTTVGE